MPIVDGQHSLTSFQREKEEKYLTGKHVSYMNNVETKLFSYNYYNFYLMLFLFCILYRTVGVTSFLKCSKCDAHIGLLTDNDGEVQYYTNGVSMTFSPKDKQKSTNDSMPPKLQERVIFKDTDCTIPPKLTMAQMVGIGRDLN